MKKSKNELEKAIKKAWPIALSWLGRSESKSEEILLKAGLQNADCGALRNRLIENLGPSLEEANLDLPISNDAITGEWLIGTELSWENWDDAFRRFNKKGPDSSTFKQISCFEGHNYPVGSSS